MGIMSIMDESTTATQEEKQVIVQQLETAKVEHPEHAEELNKIIVPLVKGEQVKFLDIQEKLNEVTAYVCAVTVLPVPSDYTLYLVRMKGFVYVIIHQADWLRMADGVRFSENVSVDTVTSYLKMKGVDYLSISRIPYGGMKNLSLLDAANRLWKSVTGKKLRAQDLI